MRYILLKNINLINFLLYLNYLLIQLLVNNVLKYPALHKQLLAKFLVPTIPTHWVQMDPEEGEQVKQGAEQLHVLATLSTM